MLATSLLLSACGSHPLPRLLPLGDDHADLRFATQATLADGHARQQLWHEVFSAPRTPASALRLAWLQSLPGHPGYDLPAAARSLRTILNGDTDVERTALVRLRLAQLEQTGTVAGHRSTQAMQACQDEVEALKRRLADVVDIERRMNQKE